MQAQLVAVRSKCVSDHLLPGLTQRLACQLERGRHAPFPQPLPLCLAPHLGPDLIAAAGLCQSS